MNKAINMKDLDKYKRLTAKSLSYARLSYLRQILIWYVDTVDKIEKQRKLQIMGVKRYATQS